MIDKNKIKELVEAAKPFLDNTVVAETFGRIPLMERLKKAINEIEKEL